MKILKCMKNHFNGSHWGLSDWYPEIEKGIKNALIEGDDFTTGWYSSKKEIASANITLKNHRVTVEVSVWDDFDTQGNGSIKINFPRYSIRYNIENVKQAIFKAWDDAEKERKDNKPFIMYKIMHNDRWIETYLVCNDFIYADAPPGDHYYEWGWQGDSDIPDGIKQKLEDAIHTAEKSGLVNDYNFELVE